jgi:hypothetical protein
MNLPVLHLSGAFHLVVSAPFTRGTFFFLALRPATQVRDYAIPRRSSDSLSRGDAVFRLLIFF